MSVKSQLSLDKPVKYGADKDKDLSWLDQIDQSKSIGRALVRNKGKAQMYTRNGYYDDEVVDINKNTGMRKWEKQRFTNIPTRAEIDASQNLSGGITYRYRVYINVGTEDETLFYSGKADDINDIPVKIDQGGGEQWH